MTKPISFKSIICVFLVVSILATSLCSLPDFVYAEEITQEQLKQAFVDKYGINTDIGAVLDGSKPIYLVIISPFYVSDVDVGDVQNPKTYLSRINSTYYGELSATWTFYRSETETVDAGSFGTIDVIHRHYGLRLASSVIFLSNTAPQNNKWQLYGNYSQSVACTYTDVSDYLFINTPTNNYKFFEGEAIRINSVSVTAKNNCTYQWYVNGENSNADGTAVSGATSMILNDSSRKAPGDYYYYLSVSDGTNVVKSDPIKVSVYYVPKIVLETSDQEVTITDKQSLKLMLSGDFNEESEYSFQWYKKSDETDIELSGQTASSLVIGDLEPGDYTYFCKVLSVDNDYSAVCVNFIVHVVGETATPTEPATPGSNIIKYDVETNSNVLRIYPSDTITLKLADAISDSGKYSYKWFSVISGVRTEIVNAAESEFKLSGLSEGDYTFVCIYTDKSTNVSHDSCDFMIKVIESSSVVPDEDISFVEPITPILRPSEKSKYSDENLGEYSFAVIIIAIAAVLAALIYIKSIKRCKKYVQHRKKKF